MLRNQLSSFKTVIAIAVIFFVALVLTVVFNTQSLFWILLIILGLLVFCVYQFRQKKSPLLQKYFNDEQELSSSKSVRERFFRSSFPTRIRKNDLRVLIGGQAYPHPYKTSIFNVRVKSHVVEPFADIREAKLFDVKMHAQSVSLYDLIENEQLLHIGPDYAGCRTKRGGFDVSKFKKLACQPSVKMIELDLSLSAYPFYDLISTIGISYVSIRKNKTLLSSLGYTMFSDAEGLILFLEKLHNLSGGKPVGIKLRVESKKEFYSVCYAIKKIKFIPDFIVVESSEQNVFNSLNHTQFNGMPLYEAVLFVSKTLEVYGLDKEIKIIAAANILSGFALLKLLSLGASVVWSEIPGYKILKNNKDGTNEYLVYGKQDVADFHNSIISDATHIMEANGLKSLKEITLSTFF